ncbi:MAG: hypothetical protein IKK27_01185 [Alistipes sp.]|nr:hypothetical protein [Rikenellaceae bacterium]MBR3792543.1 hypothetical protein [Alistipes sp.]MBR7115453.1 hypothetical protein [Alistipes sp.]
MKRFLLTLMLGTALSFATYAQQSEAPSNNEVQTTQSSEKPSRLTIGGYGEAVYTRNFFSDKYLRYTDAGTYKDDKSHGRFDLPHVVLWLGYDFGRGWSLGTEIEFEHGGTESAVEIEEEEAGEYESEVERGGEVALEQFWINKAWLGGKINLKMGHIIVPVGATNMYHMPTEFFTNYRPEGESTIMPCTWHETGVSLWGEVGKWRYEVMLLPGLDSDRFGRQTWVAGGAGSPYEFKIANSYAGAFRVDNFSVKGLRLSLSGYVGNSFRNTLSVTANDKYKDVKGTVAIGSFDFCYDAHDLIVRGNFDYGHLTDSELITKYNMSMRNDSPSPKQAIGSDAISAGVEAGYDLFGIGDNAKLNGQSLYLFGRYEYYDSMYKTEGTIQDSAWCGRQRVAVGLNYRPISDIVIKAEYSIGLLDKAFNNEPSFSIGIAYSGLFKR